MYETNENFVNLWKLVFSILLAYKNFLHDGFRLHLQEAEGLGYQTLAAQQKLGLELINSYFTEENRRLIRFSDLRFITHAIIASQMTIGDGIEQIKTVEMALRNVLARFGLKAVAQAIREGVALLPECRGSFFEFAEVGGLPVAACALGAALWTLDDIDETKLDSLYVGNILARFFPTFYQQHHYLDGFMTVQLPEEHRQRPDDRVSLGQWITKMNDSVFPVSIDSRLEVARMLDELAESGDFLLKPSEEAAA